MAFSSSLASVINNSDVVFIAVGTPSTEDGSVDLSHVLGVAKEIGGSLTKSIVVVDKSTVPIGTAEKVQKIISDVLDERGVDVCVDVVSNPEFLKEGAAIQDFLSPDRIIIGSDNPVSRQLMIKLYEPFSENPAQIQLMGARDAEMTKYAANVMLAGRISLMNEIALLGEYYGVDVENVRCGIGADPRIGPSFISPGVGYGGSCFPKDVRGLISMASDVGFDATMIRAIERRNDRQKSIMADKIINHFGDDLTGLNFAIWGLSFKPETDDIRESPSLRLIEELLLMNAAVSVYDPEAIEATKGYFLASSLGSISYASSAEDAVRGADALVIMTEWQIFKTPDFKYLQSELKAKVIFDGRNIYSPASVSEYGFDYIGIGRSASPNLMEFKDR